MSQQFPIPRTTRGPLDYTTGPGQVSFPFPFYLSEAQDVQVRIRPPAGAAFGAALVLGVDYQVAGLDTLDGATVVLTAPRVVDSTVRLLGLRLPSRTTSVTQGGSVRSTPLERELDLLVTTQQEFFRDLQRGLADLEASDALQLVQNGRLDGHDATLSDHESRIVTGQQALDAANSARSWAQQPYGQDVVTLPGGRSALHWAQVAQQFSAVTATLAGLVGAILYDFNDAGSSGDEDWNNA